MKGGTSGSFFAHSGLQFLSLFCCRWFFGSVRFPVVPFPGVKVCQPLSSDQRVYGTGYPPPNLHGNGTLYTVTYLTMYLQLKMMIIRCHISLPDDTIVFFEHDGIRSLVIELNKANCPLVGVFLHSLKLLVMWWCFELGRSQKNYDRFAQQIVDRIPPKKVLPFIGVSQIPSQSLT